MFNGFKIINNDYVYLYLDNNYEFASDINTRDKKQNKIIDDTKNFLMSHNISFDKKLYYVSNGTVIGYINKYNLK